MPHKLKARCEGDHIVLDEPPPAKLASCKLTLLVEEPGAAARPEEIAQSKSGFVAEILLDEAEDVWDAD